MSPFFQTLSGAPHWPSIITVFGWIVTTASIGAGLYLSKNERMSIKGVSGTIVLVFDQPIAANSVRLAKTFGFDTAVLAKAPLDSSATLANLTIDDYRLVPVDGVVGHSDAPIFSIRFTISSTPRLFKTRLGKVQAVDFERAFDYLHISSLVSVPPNTSFRGGLHLVINDMLEKRFEIPRHHIDKFTQVTIPLNAHALSLMSEYKMFNPEATKLTYTDMDAQPPVAPSSPGK